MANFVAGTHGRPGFRKRGKHEGFRIVAVKATDIRRLSRNVGEVRIPKAGWIRFRWSRPVPDGVKSFAFAAIPQPIAALRTGEVAGVIAE